MIVNRFSNDIINNRNNRFFGVGIMKRISVNSIKKKINEANTKSLSSYYGIFSGTKYYRLFKIRKEVRKEIANKFGSI